VHDLPKGHLQGFKIKTPLAFSVSKSDLDQPFDFAPDFFEDVRFRFFWWETGGASFSVSTSSS
jgi:hypothetical protein